MELGRFWDSIVRQYGKGIVVRLELWFLYVVLIGFFIYVVGLVVRVNWEFQSGLFFRVDMRFQIGFVKFRWDFYIVYIFVMFFFVLGYKGVLQLEFSSFQYFIWFLVEYIGESELQINF